MWFVPFLPVAVVLSLFVGLVILHRRGELR